MKPEDRAQEFELEEWESNQQRAIMTLTDQPSAENCIDCGEPIPQERREAIQGVQTCVECKALKEKREGKYR